MTTSAHEAEAAHPASHAECPGSQINEAEESGPQPAMPAEDDRRWALSTALEGTSSAHNRRSGARCKAPWETWVVSRALARFRSETTPRRWLWLLPAVGMMTGLSGCGTASAARSAPVAPVEIHVRLDQTRVVQGTPIRGQAVLTNTTSKSLLVHQCAADGWLLVGLTDGKVPFNPATALVACPPSIRLQPGANRFPITVATTYQECLQPGGQSTTYVPPCSHVYGLPPLPAGVYTTKAVTYGLPAKTAIPRPIMVTVTHPPVGGQ